ncbi:MAG TPA: Xaa-Pro peptidase family protein [Planctomycetota bacterium]|nr:Xaa-Pro peptidase family protein [Planctomycetota bacterium]
MPTTVPGSEIARRLSAVQSAMRSASPPLDVLIVVQKADLYWLSGTVQECHLIVPAEGDPRLLVRKVLERAEEDSPLEDVKPMKSLRELESHVREVAGAPPWRIAMELDVLPVNAFRSYEKRFDATVEWSDASPLLTRLRGVKSDWEIERIRSSGAVHAELFARVPEILARSSSTFDLQTTLDKIACDLGHCGLIRMRGLDVECATGLVVSGREGAMPSHSMFPIGGRGTHAWAPTGGTRSPIERDVPIAMDYLVCREAYYADCTRMAVLGRFPPEAERIFAAIRETIRACEAMLRPGIAPSAIYERATELARELGIGDGFMGPPGFAVRFVGHGIGLEVNETPVLAPGFDEPIVAGNVFAVEPKFTHPTLGVIGLENTYVVRESGAELLTPASEEPYIANGG